MSTNLGSWIQELVLKTDQFSAGVKSASSSAGELKVNVSKTIGDVTKSLGFDIQAMSTKIAPMLGPAAGAFEGLAGSIASTAAPVAGFIVAGLAIGKWAQGTLKDIGAVGKAAEKLGGTVEGMQQLRLGGQMKGVDEGTLDFGLHRVNQQIGQMKEAMSLGENSGFASTLNRIGINAREFISLPTDQAFQQLVGGLGNVSNSADRTALATSIFGKQARDLMEMIGSGSGVFTTAQARMDLFGTSLSKMDTEKARGATKSIGIAAASVSMTLEGVGNSTALALAPTIKIVSDLFTTAIETIQPAVKVVRAVISGVGDILSFLVTSARALIDPWVAWWQGKWMLIGAVVDGVIDVFRPFFNVLQNLTTRIAGVKAVGDVIRAVFSGIARVIRGAFSVVATVTQAIADTIEWVIDKIGGGIGWLWDKLVAGFEHLKRVGIEVRNFFASVIDSVTFGLTNLTGAIQRMEQASNIEAVIRRMESVRAASQNPQERLNIDRQITDLRSQLAELRGEVEQTVTLFRRPSVDWFEGASTNFDSALRQVDSIRARVESIRPPTADGTATDQFDKDIGAMMRKIAIMRSGLAEDVWTLTQRGFSSDQIDQFRSVQNTLKALELQKRLADELQTSVDKSQEVFTVTQAFDPRQSVGIRTEALRVAEREASFQTRINQLIRDGATEQMLAATRMQQLRQNEFDDLRQLQQRMGSVLQSVQSPIGSFRDQLRDLDAGLRAGVLTRDQHALGVANAFQTFDRSMPQWENPRALQQGSTEASSAISRAVREGRTVDQQERLRLVMESVLRTEEEKLRVAKEQLDAIRANQLLAAGI